MRASGHSALHLQAPPTRPPSTRTPAFPNSCPVAFSQPSGCAHLHHGLPSAGQTRGRGSGRVQNRLRAIWASERGGAWIEVDISPRPGRRLRREGRVRPFSTSGSVQGAPLPQAEGRAVCSLLCQCLCLILTDGLLRRLQAGLLAVLVSTPKASKRCPGWPHTLKFQGRAPICTA